MVMFGVEESVTVFGSYSCWNYCGMKDTYYLKIVDKQIWVWYGFAAVIYAAVIMY